MLTLCKEFLNGVKSVDPNRETEIINVYDLNFTGCKSCLAFKKIGATYGKCIIKDELHEVLNRIANADGIVFGSPIYFLDISAQLKCLLERLLFPFHIYESDEYGVKTIAPKKMPTAMIYTMNSTEEIMKSMGVDKILANTENFIGHIFTKPDIYYSFNIYQFNDYTKYKQDVFSESEKAKQRDT